MNGAKVEILLIEDNAADVAFTLNTLKKANLCNNIHVLRRSSEAIDFVFRTGASANQPLLPPETLIMLSLNVAGTEGLDLLRRIKADQRTKSLPVIILTSSQEERGMMQSYTLGASGCIVKPVDLHKFVEAVAELRLGWLLMSPEESNNHRAK
jgi:two-component system response regulator